MRDQQLRHAEWLDRRGLTPVRRGRTCWHRLVGPRLRCSDDGRPCAGHGSALGGWSDHAALYRERDGRLCWAVMPYGVSEEQRDQIDDFAYEHGLDVEISDDAWWAPGAVLVLFTH